MSARIETGVLKLCWGQVDWQVSAFLLASILFRYSLSQKKNCAIYTVKNAFDFYFMCIACT